MRYNGQTIITFNSKHRLLGSCGGSTKAEKPQEWPQSSTPYCSLLYLHCCLPISSSNQYMWTVLQGVPLSPVGVVGGCGSVDCSFRAEPLVTALLYALRPKVQVAAPLGADASEAP